MSDYIDHIGNRARKKNTERSREILNLQAILYDQLQKNFPEKSPEYLWRMSLKEAARIVDSEDKP